MTPRREKVERVIEKLSRFHGDGRYGMVWPADGKLLQVFVQLIGAKAVLEVGTGIGFSALNLCLGLLRTGGKLTTVEFDAARAREARDNMREAGVDDIVTVLEGSALDVLPRLDENFDMVFSDGIKTDNLRYFNAFMPRLRAGGIILAHDAVGPEGEKMRDYTDMLKAHASLESLPISAVGYDGDERREGPGFLFSFKKDAELDRVKEWEYRLCASTFTSGPSEPPSKAAPDLFRDYAAFEDDFGGKIYLVLADPSAGKERVVEHCRRLLDRYGHQRFLAAYVYDDEDAAKNRNNLLYPPERYFKHLIADVRRHERLEYDEITYYPDGSLFRYPDGTVIRYRQLLRQRAEYLTKDDRGHTL